MSQKTPITAACVVVMAVVLRLFVIPSLPLAWIVLWCGVGSAMAVIFRQWALWGRLLGVLIYAQFVVALLTWTFALSELPELPALFHLMFLLPIIPCALLSQHCGLFMAGAATIAHLWLCHMTGLPLIDATSVGTIFLYFMLAHQCFFYGRRLAEKTVAAEEEARLSAALVRVARALASSESSLALVQRLAELARELLSGTWACVLLRDAERNVWRVVGVVTRTGIAEEEILSVEFGAEDFPAQLAAAATDGYVEVDSEASPIPRSLRERWRFGALCAAVLRRVGEPGAEEPIGLLLIDDEHEGLLARPLRRRLLLGMAHQGVLALENARLVEDLQTASALKSEFIGTMSHELRSPLHAIIGYTDILREEQSSTTPLEDDNPQRDMLDRVRVHALQLLGMIETTLDVSRLEAGRLPVRIARVDLEALVAQTAEQTPEHLRKPDVQVVWEPRVALPHVLGDGRKIGTILRNLVDNALKFTERGTVRVRLSCQPGEDAESAVLTIVVHDSGMGIRPDQLDLIFEMFRQGDGSDSRRHAGIGLGLYIVKRLVQVMDGTVSVASEVGVGSRFEVKLPVRLADGAADSFRASA